MSTEKSPMSSKEALELYFLDNRARLLDIASFLDRIDRYHDSSTATADFRYQAFIKALRVITDSDKDRTEKIQLVFSDVTEEPIESATDPRAYGAWNKAQ